MPAILHGIEGLTFGLSAETGGVVFALTIRHIRDTAEVVNNAGDVVGVSLYREHYQVTISFYTTGTTGIGALTPGAIAASLANLSVGSAKIIVTSVTLSARNTEYQTKEITFVVYPSITNT